MKWPPLRPSPPTGRLRPFVDRLKGGAVVEAKAEGNGLAMQVSGVAALVAAASIWCDPIGKAHLFKRADRPAHLRFGQPKVSPVGQLAPVNWEARPSMPEVRASGASTGPDPRQSRR